MQTKEGFSFHGGNDIYVSVMEEFVPLINGLTAVIASDDEINNPMMLGDLIVKIKLIS